MTFSLELRAALALFLLILLPTVSSEKHKVKFALNKHHIVLDQISAFDQLSDVHVKFQTIEIGETEVTLVQKANGDLEARKGYKIALEQGEKECAAGKFENTIQKIGWDRLHIKTAGSCGSIGSFWAAGWVEGYLTGVQIENYLHDMFQNTGDDDYQTFNSLYTNIYTQTRQKAEYTSHHQNMKPEHNKLWGTMNLFLAQFEGMVAGAKVRRPDSEYITLPNMLLLNSNGEKGELLEVLPNIFADDMPKQNSVIASFLQLSARRNRKSQGQRNLLEELYERYGTRDPKKLWKLQLMDTHCSVLFKVVRDKDNKITNVIGSHGTWDDFTDMLKVMKSYDLTALQYPGSEEPSTSRKILFPSYPGCITSQDDFYVNENGLVVTETTLEILDRKLYETKMNREDYFPSFLRLSAANFLGKTAEDWIHWYSLVNTGTYNSQWMLLETSQVEKAIDTEKIPPKTFFVLEQIPGSIKIEDLSTHMNQEGYWSSYNIPYYPEHYENAGYANIQALTHSDEYSYDRTPRRLLFDKLQADVKDVDSMKKVIRYNDWDPNAINQLDAGNQQADPGDTIAARYDLLDDHDLNYYFGETDAKVIDFGLAKSFALYAVAGPTSEGNMKPFKFPDDIFIKFKGIPQEYNFKWELFTFDR